MGKVWLFLYQKRGFVLFAYVPALFSRPVALVQLVIQTFVLSYGHYPIRV